MGKITKRISDTDLVSIKKVLKMSGGILLWTNLGYNSDYVGAYKLHTADFDNDDLVYMICCRVSSGFAIKIDQLACNYLFDNYNAETYTIMTRAEFLTHRRNAKENGGHIGENVLEDIGLYKKGTLKQDRQGIDVIELKTNKRYQVKTSIAWENSKGSASITHLSTLKD